MALQDFKQELFLACSGDADNWTGDKTGALPGNYIPFPRKQQVFNPFLQVQKHLDGDMNLGHELWSFKDWAIQIQKGDSYYIPN